MISKQTKIFKCPKCGKEITSVNVISNCWQKAELEGNKIVDWGSLEDILDTLFIECPECQAQITKHIEQ